VTEVGRQPWIVYNIARTSNAVTTAKGVNVSLIAIFVLYAFLAVATITVLRAMATRLRLDTSDDESAPYGSRPDASAETAPEPEVTAGTGGRES
jgi:cytochrome d ubiquinol oxidase subunit I